MQVSVADAGKLRKLVTISYSPAEVQTRRNQALRTFASQAKMDGFRPGKSPVALIEKRYGAAASQSAEEQLADEGFDQALKDNGLKPFGPMKNEKFSRDNGLEIAVSFDLRPSVTLPAAKDLTITIAEATVSDAELDEQLKALARRAGSMSPLAEGETVIEDDSITVSGTVTVAGVEARKLHDFNHLVGGYPFFGKAPADVIAAFADKKIGDTVTFTATLPASFTPAEHAGKDGEISVTVQAANRLRAAPIDDDFAKKLGAESLEALKTVFRLRLQSGKESEARGKQVNELTEQLLATVQVELPEALLAATVAEAKEQAAKGKTGEEAEKAQAEAAADAEKSLRRFVILDTLASQLDIKVTNEDFDDQIRMAAYHTQRNPRDIAEQLRKSGKAQQVAMEIREAKAIDTFLDQVIEAHKPAASATAG